MRHRPLIPHPSDCLCGLCHPLRENSARSSGLLPAPAASQNRELGCGAESDDPNAVVGAVRSPLADAIRFAFQKHERALWSNLIQLNDRSVDAKSAAHHAQRMFVAAVLELSEAIEEEIDRRVAARLSERGTFFRGGRL